MNWSALRSLSRGSLRRGVEMDAQAVPRVNVASLEVKRFPDLPAGFRPDRVRVGKLLGATRTGMRVYELPPGEAIGPYHYEDPDEEWLLGADGPPSGR